MRILYAITRGDDLGGAQTHVRDMAHAMLQTGHTVRVITGSEGSFTEQLDALSIPRQVCRGLHRDIRMGSDLSALRELRSLITEFRPDIVTLHSSKAGVLGRLACRGTRAACIFTAHGWAFSGGVPRFRRALFQRMECAVEKLARKIISVSDYDYRLGLAAGMDERRLILIHNGITNADATDSFHRTQTSKFCKVVMVARFGFPKDHMALLRAAVRIPHISVLFVGDGPQMLHTQEAAKRLGIADRVEFRGRTADVQTALSEADVFCLLSRHEGFPYTTLEAMRSGLPTVVSDVGGAGEAVRDGITGFQLPKGDEDRLYACLSLLAHQPWLRREMGNAAKEHFEQNFTFDRMFDQTLGVYEEVLAGRN